MDRRKVVGGLAATTLIGPFAVARAQDDPAVMPPQVGDYIALTSSDSTPLTPDALTVAAAPRRAWPLDPATMTPRSGTVYNLLMVSRWAPDALTEDAAANAADGVVALTAICTHAACDISDWAEDVQAMECPCHFSRFDPRANGAVVQGPAARRLPALKLELDGGNIVIAAPWDSRVGGDMEE
jgi:rieske iron-sulfur protein